MSQEESEDQDTITINEEEAGERLDKILSNRFKEVKSRTYFQYLIEEKRVLLNGEPVKKRVKPKEGDEIQIFFILTPEMDLRPESIPLSIVYEDDDILVINKKPGMVVHPAPGHWSGTFVNALLFHCKSLEISGQVFRPGIVHRLDKETSGLLVAAKTSQAQQKLIEMFANRQVYKEYIAVCVGNPGNREIRAPIGRHPVHRKMMCVLEDGGRLAISICKTLFTDGKISIVKVVLETGRTHQIRVHMKHLASPILGDSIYGNAQVNKKYGVGRQMLHAQCLRFKHPISGKDLEFTASVPEDMKKWIDQEASTLPKRQSYSCQAP